MSKELQVFLFEALQSMQRKLLIVCVCFCSFYFSKLLLQCINSKVHFTFNLTSSIAYHIHIRAYILSPSFVYCGKCKKASGLDIFTRTLIFIRTLRSFMLVTLWEKKADLWQTTSYHCHWHCRRHSKIFFIKQHNYNRRTKHNQRRYSRLINKNRNSMCMSIKIGDVQMSQSK